MIHDVQAHICSQMNVAIAAMIAGRLRSRRSEVPRDPRESEDRRRCPDISHHARAGLTRQECQEPLHRVTYTGRRPAGRRAIVGGVIIPGPLRAQPSRSGAQMHRSNRANDLCLRIY